MKFEISLSDIILYAFIGVEEWERQIGTQFKVNLSVFTHNDLHTLNDNIDATISYAHLYEIVEKEMSIKRKLLETTCAAIAQSIKNRYPGVESGKITIEKINPPIPGMVGKASVTLFF